MSLLSVGEIIEIIFTWYYIKSMITKERKTEWKWFENQPLLNLLADDHETKTWLTLLFIIIYYTVIMNNE